MLAVDKENFQAEVKEAEGLVLVDFWSESCVPCKAIMPDVLALAEKYGTQVKFTKLDVMKARKLAIGEKVLGVPTIILYKDGNKIDELANDVTAEGIEAMIQKNL